MNIPVQIFDAYNRFSTLNQKSQEHNKYTNLLSWFNDLQNKNY